MNMEERHAKSRVLWRKYYADVPTREAVLDAAVERVLQSGHVLLDAGCGDTMALLNRYSPRVSLALGVDLVRPPERPGPKAAVAIADLGRLPLRDASVDVVVSRSVLEHLEDPCKVFVEFARVLRPGGRLLFTTPNKYYYSSLVAGMIPYRWKDRFMHWVFGETSYDHFPVFYRANTRRAFRQLARTAHLRINRVDAIRHFPYYFLFSPLLFRLGMLYDRAVTRLRLDGLQSNWLVEMERV